MKLSQLHPKQSDIVISHIFFLPLYFQAVRGTTAEESGIRTIPFLVTVTLASIIVGGSITVLGYYTPFTWFGSALFCVGAGLLYTLRVDTSTGKWIGYQIVAGFGAGAGIQIPFIAVQVVLNSKDMPIGSMSPTLVFSSRIDNMVLSFENVINKT